MTYPKTIPAGGVTGFLITDYEGVMMFRVYDDTHPERFRDYSINHNDLEVTINPDADAVLYQVSDHDGTIEIDPESY